MLVSVPFTERDPVFMPYIEEFAREVDAQVIFFEEADHFIHQYEPERVADLLKEFLTELQRIQKTPYIT